MNDAWLVWRKRNALAALLVSVCFALAALLPTTPGLAQQAPPADADLAQRAAKARELTVIYSDKLRAGLAQAIKEGGPVGAIGACNTLAPDLNASVSEASTFEITRTSLRVRNPDNAPDTWEQAGLEQFQKAIAGGADPKTLETFDVVTTTEGQRLFRYMRPIVMGEQCMACHGPNVSTEVKAEIAKYYSDDKALGYSLGEMRGAFSLVQQLD